jgi:hypothetical protein
MFGAEQITVLRSEFDKRTRYQKIWNAACLFGGTGYTRRVPEWISDEEIDTELDKFAAEFPAWDEY